MLNNSSVTYRDHVRWTLVFEMYLVEYVMGTTYPVLIFPITSRHWIFSITSSSHYTIIFTIGKDKPRIAVDLVYLQSPGFSEISLNDHHKTTTTTKTDNNLKNPPKYSKSNSEVVSPHFIMLWSQQLVFTGWGLTHSFCFELLKLADHHKESFFYLEKFEICMEVDFGLINQ